MGLQWISLPDVKLGSRERIGSMHSSSVHDWHAQTKAYLQLAQDLYDLRRGAPPTDQDAFRHRPGPDLRRAWAGSGGGVFDET